MAQKILLVEDDTLLVKMYATILTNNGFEVVTAGDGEEALQLVRTQKPALVMMDIMMPKMNGLQALDAIRNDPAVAKIPVIMLTGLSKVNEEKDVLARGANLYLDKSKYDPKDVMEKIKLVLSGSGQVQTQPQTPSPAQQTGVQTGPVAQEQSQPLPAQTSQQG